MCKKSKILKISNGGSSINLVLTHSNDVLELRIGKYIFRNENNEASSYYSDSNKSLNKFYRKSRNKHVLVVTISEKKEAKAIVLKRPT